MSSLVDFSPLLRLLGLAALVALLPLSWVWLRGGRRGGQQAPRLALLTALTVFLTFDLIVFGAFTRLSDSGLGCPDWPGCYGHASPLGASVPIAQAEAAMPSGPVTMSKAWIEMIHRYLAMTVGALCLVMAVAGWVERRALPHSPWWPTLTLLWVLVQGLFGKYTVTLKLYPAIVTLHLLGGLLLLAMLAVQRESFKPQPVALPPPVRRLAGVALLVLVVQVALGGWVSTNYAVLACSGFPACNGQWWPQADYANGFSLLRDLGHTTTGELLPFDALVAIHWVHRLFAGVATVALLWLAIVLSRQAGAWAGLARTLAVVTLLQVATGLSNVVLHWPLVAALLHSGGAAALVLLLTQVLARSAVVRTLPHRLPAQAGLA